MKKTLTVLVIVLVAASLSFAQTTQSPNLLDFKYKINDVHCHYVNFVQNTQGVDTLLMQMDNSGVDNIVLFGLSVTKEWTDFDRDKPIYYDDNDAPVYYYSCTDIILAEAIKNLPTKQKNRIYPMICGFNPADKNGVDHIKRMVEMYPDLWVGIGEIFFRHDDLTRMTYGRNPTANCNTMEPVYKYAAEKSLPLWIHSDIGNPVADTTTFLYEMEDAIKNHPEATIVWCHAGDTRGLKIYGLAEITERLLDTYSNLYYDISWVVLDQVIAPEGIPDPKWIQLFEKHADRFMVGSDKIGDFTSYTETIRRYDVLFDALSIGTAKKLASENMFKLLKEKN